MSTPKDLADTLSALTPAEYVRFVADWLKHAHELEAEPDLTDIAPIDALVAAAVAHVAFTAGAAVPAWTTKSTRICDPLWYPGPDSLFPNALVHSPLSFFVRGVLVEADSLTSV